MLNNFRALAVAACLAGGLGTTAPALAGDVHRLNVGVAVSISGGHHHHHAHRLPVPAPHGPHAYRGPALYYSYHYDHIAAYPVPVFPSHHPVVVRHHTVVQPVLVGHVEWCRARYRSYHAHDNSFQPYHGPRRQCRSPYG